MKEHMAFGMRGEELAAGWLMQRGYEILSRNWRHGRSEVDIIARKEGIVHFVEVKSRRSKQFGFPEESVDERKMNQLMKAADEYMQNSPEGTRIQFDVLAIRIEGNTIEYFLLEDLYL